MNPIAAYSGDAIQVALVAVSTVLAVVSVRAYRKRPEGRYLLLMLAFVFFCASSVATTGLELFTGIAPSVLLLVELYVTPSLELLAVISFLAAMMWSPTAKKYVPRIFAVALLAVGVGVSTAYLYSSPAASGGTQPPLPAGCVRPAGGFLIVASSTGYNDSISHGAPTTPWPVIDVAQGTMTRITVCNTYAWTVGFQVAHYLADGVDAVPPGQVVDVNFLANDTGTFLIYCSTFNPIHIYLQGGELNVL